jgi:hypothetical protein
VTKDCETSNFAACVLVDVFEVLLHTSGGPNSREQGQMQGIFARTAQIKQSFAIILPKKGRILYLCKQTGRELTAKSRELEKDNAGSYRANSLHVRVSNRPAQLALTPINGTAPRDLFYGATYPLPLVMS